MFAARANFFASPPEPVRIDAMHMFGLNKQENVETEKEESKAVDDVQMEKERLSNNDEKAEDKNLDVNDEKMENNMFDVSGEKTEIRDLDAGEEKAENDDDVIASVEECETSEGRYCMYSGIVFKISRLGHTLSLNC